MIGGSNKVISLIAGALLAGLLLAFGLAYVFQPTTPVPMTQTTDTSDYDRWRERVEQHSPEIAEWLPETNESIGAFVATPESVQANSYGEIAMYLAISRDEAEALLERARAEGEREPDFELYFPTTMLPSVPVSEGRAYRVTGNRRCWVRIWADTGSGDVCIAARFLLVPEDELPSSRRR